jgi:acetyltransferase-like isoleucine patch superfamily enzyme
MIYDIMGENYKIQQSLSNGTDSALQRYMKLILGTTSLGRLIVFELVMLIACRRSGALGLVLRKKMYPWILKSVGKGVVFGAGVTLRHPHKITIGDGAIVDDNVMLDAKGDSNKGIKIGDGVFIGRNSILSCKDGDIVLDTNVNIGFNCLLTSNNRIEIGADNIIAAYSYILGGGNYKIDGISTPIRENYDYHGKGGVVTGGNVWIGAHVTLLDGVTIGSGCVIGAGSIVSKSFPEDTVLAGSPAKSLRTRK